MSKTAYEIGCAARARLREIKATEERIVAAARERLEELKAEREQLVAIHDLACPPVSVVIQLVALVPMPHPELELEPGAWVFFGS